MQDATILIVDDSRLLRSMLRKTLEELGYRVVDANNGVAALDVLASSLPNLVISDVNMDEMDGLTLLTRIRGRFRKNELPVLMLTTEASDAMKTKGRDLGANGWICKPYDPERVKNVLRHLLEAR